MFHVKHWKAFLQKYSSEKSKIASGREFKMRHQKMQFKKMPKSILQKMFQVKQLKTFSNKVQFEKNISLFCKKVSNDIYKNKAQKNTEIGPAKVFHVKQMKRIQRMLLIKS